MQKVRTIVQYSGGFRGGAQGPPSLLVEYLRKICKKMTEISIQKPF